jgi:hypothetical protein
MQYKLLDYSNGIAAGTVTVGPWTHPLLFGHQFSWYGGARFPEGSLGSLSVGLLNNYMTHISGLPSEVSNRSSEHTMRYMSE